MSETIKVRDEIPEEFASLAEAGEFWDAHDSGEYEDLMTPVEIEFDLHEQELFIAVAKDVAVRLQAKAREQGVGAETLVNLWLAERLHSLAPGNRRRAQKVKTSPPVERGVTQLAEESPSYQTVNDAK